MSIINKHHDEGGTGLTNFPSPQLNIYKEAVSLYGDSDLIVSDLSMYGVEGQGSIHCLANKDLSDFWEFFEAFSHVPKTVSVIEMDGDGCVIKKSDFFDDEAGRKVAEKVFSEAIKGFGVEACDIDFDNGIWESEDGYKIILCHSTN